MAEEDLAASRIAEAELTGFVAAAYRAVGIAAPAAERAAELMAASDLSGADGHGVFRLPQYIRRIKAGGLNIAPDIRVIQHSRAAAIIDGDNGLGSLIVARAVEEAIALARETASAGLACAAATMPARLRSMQRCRWRTT